jgi:hypothetical protein
MDKPVKPEIKKPYEPPRLLVYGTVRDLTEKNGPTRTVDGGSFPKNRTGFH